AQGMDLDRFRLTVLLTSPSDCPEVLAEGSMKAEFERAGVEIIQLDRSNYPGGTANGPEPGRRSRGFRIGALKRLGVAIMQIRRLIVKLGIDVVDARLDAGGINGVPAARWTGRPSVLTEYGVCPTRKYPMWQVARQAAFGAVNFVITDSQMRAQEI